MGDASTAEIVRVDLILGTQSLVTDLESQLGTGFAPWALSLATPRDLYVVARFADAVVHVDPLTGVATPLSVDGLLVDRQALASTTEGPVVFDFDDWPAWEALGELDDDPYITTFDCDGKGYCSTQDVWDLASRSSPPGSRSAADWVETPGPQARFELVAFDAMGGVVSSVSELAAGRSSATLSVADAGGFSRIEFRVFDPDFVPGAWSDSAFLWEEDVTFGMIPWILVADAGTASVVRVDPRDGTESLLTQGGLLDAPRGIAVSESREIRVTDDGRVVGIDFATGSQTSLTSGGWPEEMRGITVVPESGHTLGLAAGVGLLALLTRNRARRVSRSA